MNEELRSTMEELETSKEELQSVNEELQTVNDENRHRVEELSQLTADLQNLLKSTDIATLFLDRGLRILRFTPSVTGIFNVRSADRGRPLADLNHRLNYQGLIEDAARVLDRLIPVENEVEAQDGRSYLLRILPYRTADDRIDGVVITFIDISALKRSQAELRELNETLEQRVEERTRRLRESEARFQALVHASAQIVWTADPDGVVVEDSPSWRAFTGQRLEDWLGEGWLDAVHRDDRDGAQREWRGAVDARAPLDTEFRIAQLGGDWRCMRVRAVPLYDDARLTGWVGMMTDVTEARDAEEQLRETRARLAVVEQDERHRIATILHDDLQQRLFAIQLKIATLRNGLERGDDADRLGRLFQEANEWIDEAIQMTRRLSVDLSPPVLRGDGLEDALLWLLEQMRERHRLEVELDLDGGVPELDDEMRVLVFHVVRELLFNVVKHAGATTARVDIRRDADDLVVRVSDQGGGFEAGGLASSGLPRNGFGLFNIRDRLLLLGGAMEIESSPGAGTRVALRVPLEGRGPAR